MENTGGKGEVSLEKLQARIEYLEAANSWYFIALERLATLGELYKDVQRYHDPQFLFANARNYLKQHVKFRTLAFFLVNESDNQFSLADCYPESDTSLIKDLTDEQIEKGNFAWALRQSRPLIVQDGNSRGKIILHVLATKSRIRGMFAGRLDESVQKIPGEQLNLISIILSNTAYAIENGSLYKFVSGQKADLEETVKKRTQTLENKARDLKKEIAERKKVEAELKRSNQDLQDFASIASHDLQEPLRKVIMFGDRLSKHFADGLDAAASGYLERMRGAAARMQTLIDELLQFSRINTKAKPFRPTALDEIVHEVLSDLESRIIRSGARVHVESLPAIDADAVQIRQLFQNLIGNALKFHKAGVVPEVLVRGDSNGSTTCKILVQDNGIGFDEKHSERIFKPFERLHGRSEYEGSGMGLSICNKIVSRHGGTIQVRSQPDKGATFIVILPLKQPESQ